MNKMTLPPYLGPRRCCDIESTSLTLIQRHNNVVCPVGNLQTQYSKFEPWQGQYMHPKKNDEYKK